MTPLRAVPPQRLSQRRETVGHTAMLWAEITHVAHARLSTAQVLRVGMACARRRASGGACRRP